MARTNSKIKVHKKESCTDECQINTGRLLRMPWTTSDNAFSWLEITRRCDLNCGYCYQSNDLSSDKPISQIEKELKAILHLRKTDSIFISGGEPLLHPDLEQIVKMVNSHSVKPVILTNGNKLSKGKIKTLKANGLFGFVIHVDRGQSRPGWAGKSEKELNSLRQKYADMINKEGGLICGFNTTILPETLSEVPDIIKWTIENIDKVCTNTLIPVRVLSEDDPWDLYVNGRKIDYRDTAFSSNAYNNPHRKELTALDIYSQVKKVMPGFTGNAFLGGTEVPDAPKWLFANVIGTNKKIHGCMGPKTMELLQNGYHFLRGKYLSFLKPGMYGMGKMMFSMGILDREIRKSFLSFLATGIKNPLSIFKKIFVQSLLIMQPQDILPDGRQDLCDGCPNKTYHKGELVSACRKEEYLRFGGMVELKKREDGIVQHGEWLKRNQSNISC
ncbi:radical SAM protein [Thermodesulfobacteriota bacterium]